jgi:hypothetical protein
VALQALAEETSESERLRQELDALRAQYTAFRELVADTLKSLGNKGF